MGEEGNTQEPSVVKRVVPVTRVILKDGRTGVIRESKTTIKHCKRNNAFIAFFPEDGKGQDIKAGEIKSFITITQ